MDLLGGIALVVGSIFILLAGVGAARFPDVYSRLHTAAKAPTLGVLLVGIGAVASIRTFQATVAVALVVALQFIAGPVGSHMLGRAVYRSLAPPLDGPDQLAERDGRRGADDHHDSPDIGDADG
jgi:multicomponent Na+:H+ antiporter subunit G